MKIGAHEWILEEPDLLVFDTNGEITLADAIAGGDAIVELSAGKQMFIMNIVRPGQGDAMKGEARRAFMRRLKTITLVAVAVVGANFHIRILARLLDAAFRLLSGRQALLGFFDTPELARVWLAENGCVACQKQG